MHDSVMALLKFQLGPTKKALPRPSGPLSTIIPASYTVIAAAANEDVKTIVTSEEKQNIVFACNSESS